MTIAAIIPWAVASVAALASVQPPGAQAPSAPAQPLALSSCTALDDANADRFTVAAPPAPGRSRYRTAGQAVLTVLGQSVHVVGRLVPTPNSAAQAGAIDPTIPAMEYMEREQFRSALGRRPGPLVRPDADGRPFRVDCAPR